MKRKMNKFYLLVLFMGTVLASNAQTKYFLDNNSSNLVVEGTSSIHDWEMEANDLKSAIVLRFNENTLTTIEHVDFASPAKKILSDNSIMNSKTHDALKVDKNPEIIFTLKSVNHLDVNGNSISGVVTGNLKIAGIARTIRINFKGKMNPDHFVTLSGTVPLKMSDFDIDPPTAMLGALKTGDDIKVHFEFLYKKE